MSHRMLSEERGDTRLMTSRLAGGKDEGAALVEGTVRRRARAWSRTVHDLLRHLEQRGFSGAPQVLGFDDQGREILTYLRGETVGQTEPWPAWTHSDDALEDIGHWLRAYHDAVADYVPPSDAVWREGGRWEAGLIIGHGDPAPYNAVWTGNGLVGLIDWDNAGPLHADDDLAWVVFSWTPLHAPEVVSREGFTALSTRRERLVRILDAYGWQGTTQEVLARVDARLLRQISTMRVTADAGDSPYRRMLEQRLDHQLEIARSQLASL
jgi:aminoglycoside phosphotransferase (APT) family kinase protein